MMPALDSEPNSSAEPSDEDVDLDRLRENLKLTPDQRLARAEQRANEILQHRQKMPASELRVFRQTAIPDAMQLREIRLEALQAVPEAFGSDYETESQRPTSFWEERAAGSPNGGNFVAEDASGHFVGLIGIFTDGRQKTGHVGNIVSVYVLPEARGQGVGDGLMRVVLSWAREQNLSRVRLAVVTTNSPAIGLYERHGFKVYGEESDVIRIGDHSYDELLMDLTL